MEQREETGEEIQDVGDDADFHPRVLVLFVHFEEAFNELGVKLVQGNFGLTELFQAAHRPTQGVDFRNVDLFLVHAHIADLFQQNLLQVLELELGEVLENLAHLIVDLGSLRNHHVLSWNSVFVNHDEKLLRLRHLGNEHFEAEKQHGESPLLEFDSIVLDDVQDLLLLG